MPACMRLSLLCLRSCGKASGILLRKIFKSFIRFKKGSRNRNFMIVGNTGKLLGISKTFKSFIILMKDHEIEGLC